MAELTHFDERGKARMVNVGDKQPTRRVAVAAGEILMLPETLALVRSGDHAKGDVLGAARIAGIMACKKTSDLVPLCHPLPLSAVAVEFETRDRPACVRCRARVETYARTGVEMEALVAVQTALLTVYDMCKAVDRGMTIDKVRLLEKLGGKSGDWKRPGEKPANEGADAP